MIHLELKDSKMVVRGRVVIIVDLKPFAPHHCVFESQTGTLDSFM
jgi:hypothetical protein